MQQDNFVEEKNEPMPMLCELTTVLQYMVAMEESMALPPIIMIFLQTVINREKSRAEQRELLTFQS